MPIIDVAYSRARIAGVRISGHLPMHELHDAINVDAGGFAMYALWVQPLEE
jgi:hypothetical protein